jgi:MoaA/NifB/PqqE/SkfB family radical SAM enzyme
MASLRTLARGASLAAYPAFRALGRPRLLPLNLTISVTNACASRCKTCEIWRKPGRDLSLAEYDAILSSMGTAVAWVTVSGGDQFLRADLPEIVGVIHDRLRPALITIPMNGICTGRIERMLPQIARRSAGCRLVLNFSIDGIGAEHDELRGRPGSWDRVLWAYRYARGLRRDFPHLAVGIHTVISAFNVDRLPAIHAELHALQPDSLIAEIAEQRVELGTMGRPITPEPAQYAAAAAWLQDQIRRGRSAHPVGRLVQALRLEYYGRVNEILRTRRQVPPCYAGWASAHLAPDGEVWGCCVRASPLGNLRDLGLDFSRAWFSPEAERFRHSVRAGECACPLASAAYSNMLFAPGSLARVARSYLK